jgi:four helix bundle protein
MSIRSYRDLEAWRLGMDLAVSVYGLTKTFPREEMYGLSSQLRRAVISIPSNISEGHQQGTKSYAHFVSLALGSLAEAETQVELANRLRYTTTKDVEAVSALATDLRRVLHGLRRSLVARSTTNLNP